MAEARASCIEVRPYGGDRLLYRVAMAPEAMPPVTLRALESVLDEARAIAAEEGEPLHRSFRFTDDTGAAADFDIEDRDARAWAAAVDRRADLGTLGGMALCLRLLALVDLLATAPWASLYFTGRGQNRPINRPLLRAAARATLTEEGRFDEASFRRNLPPPGAASGASFSPESPHAS